MMTLKKSFLMLLIISTLNSCSTKTKITQLYDDNNLQIKYNKPNLYEIKTDKYIINDKIMYCVDEENFIYNLLNYKSLIDYINILEKQRK